MQDLQPVAAPLLAWYYQHRRILPFREDPTPYNIWVSEIMLQQTRVAAALEYYARFTAALPDVTALAACGEEELHKLWQGLGYYSRVRNMQKAAKIVVEQHDGQLPDSYEALRSLPGIGDYTAGAIASIAFGLPHVAVDGNVLRVFSRLLNSPADITLPATKKALSAIVQAQQPPEKAGDYNQAIMELGALVCTPGMPNCAACPLQALCHGFKAGSAASLPIKAPKKAKVPEALCVLLVECGGKYLLQKRPGKGLLAGLWQPFALPGSYTAGEMQKELQEALPTVQLGETLAESRHIFTHKIWNMYGWHAAVPPGTNPPEGCVWASPAEIETDYSVPSAFAAYLPLMR